jgi:hypothetical protein
MDATTVRKLNNDIFEKIETLGKCYPELGGVTQPSVTVSDDGSANESLNFQWADCSTDLEIMQDIERALLAISSRLFDVEKFEASDQFKREADRIRSVITTVDQDKA